MQYDKLDAENVVAFSDTLAPFVKQVVPILPGHKKEGVRKWKDHPLYEVLITPFTHFEIRIKDTLEDPCVRAAVHLSDISMASQLAYCVDATEHWMRYLTRIKNNECVQIVTDRNKVDDLGIMLVVFSSDTDNPIGYERAKVVAARVFAFLIFMATKKDLVTPEWMHSVMREVTKEIGGA